ncbi:glycosyltransferase involved in cell wall biosynthesis [Panacagrimonas perspica]|uniref:Glycosyltransferase involved in cell wall biosynthesis n=1 Tax=Panacagrimonas perspica TaxID=381431 RepID=A0A4R7P027_9GAMM|nr:glycosyltransferase family 2 protein [Panacagrimonas perspica]TDU26758.1 glycosyltransferase involved in cell wall biosynthesis [Panacagrimonas perspica]THD04095.1 glycosyl transferase [Panacagrimonas perspica]
MPERRAFTLSVVMICRDEEDRIERALQSVQGWADEIIVLDSGSRDATVEIARRYTAKVWVTDWPGYGPQRNRAIGKASGDWILSLDADERVTPELRDEIDACLSNPDLEYNVLKMPWRTYFCGAPLRFGRFSTPQTRMFRREGASYRNLQVHESLEMPDKRVGVLKSSLEHHSWRDYHHAQEKHLLYACLLAEQKYAEGQRSSLLYASSRLVFDFLVQYIGRLCVLDGWRGFLISVILAQYAFHKYAALAMRQNGAPAMRPRVFAAPRAAVAQRRQVRPAWKKGARTRLPVPHAASLLAARTTPP